MDDEQPVAWMVYTEDGNGVYVTDNPADITANQRTLPLYTAPQKREELDDAELRACAQAMNAEPLAEGWNELVAFARAIEAAHGIGEKK